MHRRDEGVLKAFRVWCSKDLWCVVAGLFQTVWEDIMFNDTKPGSICLGVGSHDGRTRLVHLCLRLRKPLRAELELTPPGSWPL